MTIEEDQSLVIEEIHARPEKSPETVLRLQVVHVHLVIHHPRNVGLHLHHFEKEVLSDLFLWNVSLCPSNYTPEDLFLLLSRSVGQDSSNHRLDRAVNVCHLLVLPYHLDLALYRHSLPSHNHHQYRKYHHLVSIPILADLDPSTALLPAQHTDCLGQRGRVVKPLRALRKISSPGLSPRWKL